MAEIVKINGYDIKDLKSIRSYNTVALMKADTTLREGQHVKTKGYYTPGDGGSADYYIRTKTQEDIQNNGSIHFIGNLVAELINNSQIINAKQFGVHANKSTDDYTNLQNAINYCKLNNYSLLIDGYCYVSDTIDTKGIKIIGVGKPSEAKSTYTSGVYGYLQWDYLRNINNGALITFNDYKNDILITGSGIISDIANPIVECNHREGKFNLENLCICGWLRNTNQEGIKSTYNSEDNTITYIDGHHIFNNVNVINCGGNAIHLQSLEVSNVNNLQCLYNFGYGLFIEGINGIDTPFEYTKFNNCKFTGNKLGNVYALNCYRKNVIFDNCNFNSSGLYKQLNISLPESTNLIIPAVKIEGNESHDSSPREILVLKNCFAEETNVLLNVSTNGLITNKIDIHECTLLPTELNENNTILYLDTYYSNGFTFYNNKFNGEDFIKLSNNVEQLIPTLVDKRYYESYKNTRDLTFNSNLNVTNQNLYRYGNLVELDIEARAIDNISAYSNLIQGFPKPLNNIMTSCLINNVSNRLSVYTNNQITTPTAINNNDYINIHLMYFTEYEGNR